MKFKINIKKQNNNEIMASCEYKDRKFAIGGLPSQLENIIDACKNSLIVLHKYGEKVTDDYGIKFSLIPKDYDQEKEKLLHKSNAILLAGLGAGLGVAAARHLVARFS